MDYVSAVNK